MQLNYNMSDYYIYFYGDVLFPLDLFDLCSRLFATFCHAATTNFRKVPNENLKTVLCISIQLPRTQMPLNEINGSGSLRTKHCLIFAFLYNKTAFYCRCILSHETAIKQRFDEPRLVKIKWENPSHMTCAASRSLIRCVFGNNSAGNLHLRHVENW